MSREPERAFEQMLVAIGDSLSDLGSSDDGEDAEDEDDEETEQGKQSKDGKPGWVMGTITKTVQQRMATFQQKQMKLDELTQPGSSHIRVGSVKPESKSSIPSGELSAEPDSSTLLTAKPVDPVSCYPSI